MSTNPQTTAESQPTTARTTELEARGRTDRWTAPGETAAAAVARTQRQFEPTCYERLRNLMDDENAHRG